MQLTIKKHFNSYTKWNKWMVNTSNLICGDTKDCNWPVIFKIKREHEQKESEHDERGSVSAVLVHTYTYGNTAWLLLHVWEYTLQEFKYIMRCKCMYTYLLRWWSTCGCVCMCVCVCVYVCIMYLLWVVIDMHCLDLI